MKLEFINLLSGNKSPADWLKFFSQHEFKISAELEKKITQIKSTPDTDHFVALVAVDYEKRDQIKTDSIDMGLEVALLVAQKFIEDKEFLPEVFRVLIPLADGQIEILRALNMISENPRRTLYKRERVIEAYLFSSTRQGAESSRILDLADQRKRISNN